MQSKTNETPAQISHSNLIENASEARLCYFGLSDYATVLRQQESFRAARERDENPEGAHDEDIRGNEQVGDGGAQRGKDQRHGRDKNARAVSRTDPGIMLSQRRGATRSRWHYA